MKNQGLCVNGTKLHLPLHSLLLSKEFNKRMTCFSYSEYLVDTLMLFFCISASADETPCVSEQTGVMTTSNSILYPKLHFSISLHKESGELHINIVEGNPISYVVIVHFHNFIENYIAKIYASHENINM